MITSVCIVCVCGCPTYRIKEIGKYRERHGREITDTAALMSAAQNEVERNLVRMCSDKIEEKASTMP